MNEKPCGVQDYSTAYSFSDAKIDFASVEDCKLSPGWLFVLKF